MRKLKNILFYTFLIFLIISAICLYYQKINNMFVGLLLILSLVIVIFDYKNIKFDIVDFLLGFLPLSYLIPHIVHNNVFNLSLCIYYILLELSVTMTLLVIRRNIDEKRVNAILITLDILGCIYFFISFLYPLMPHQMATLGIFSYFGDEYINSIDRFYGTLVYCNSSALLFIISTFISLFKINDDNKNKNFYRTLLFINFSGFLSTFSKMLSITFLLVLISLIIINIVMKRTEFLSTIKNSFISITIPSLLFIRLFRAYLINLNILYFIMILLLLILLYICICKLLEYLDTKFIFSSYVCLILTTIIIVSLTVNPIETSLKIKNIYKNNAYIITDFILEENKDYEIIFDVEGNIEGVFFELYKLYVSDYAPKVKIVKEIKANKINKFNFKTDADFEYYFIRINNMNSKTNLKISNVNINKQSHLINSLFIPYQYIHQLDLTKYDKESVSDRLSCYRECLKILKRNNSIIGEGYNTFDYYALNSEFASLTHDPHSYLFQLWLDVGIYGPIYIIGLIVIGIINMLKYKYNIEKHIWFCIFCSCMIMVPFDAVYSRVYLRILLMLSFIMICEKNKRILK